ncbi:MarR family winged helix-turn-helix transcriptional regulator [Curtobacterium sp. RRHDQ10]|uniref:MarR family winged helix-turn-helix transcriptional regulator n=1 Tax=Curtobacterium phyllosphaerae TaxID=3413379 RepID=UPI003BF044D2
MADSPSAGLEPMNSIISESATDVDDVVAALARVEVADALLRSRLRTRLGINTTDLAALQYIDRCETAGRGAYAKDLAPLLGVTSAAMTTILDRLGQAGHVLRTADPASRRTRLLALTPATRQQLAATIGETQHRLRGLVETMNRRDRERAVKLMEEIRIALDAGAPDDGPDRSVRGLLV